MNNASRRARRAWPIVIVGILLLSCAALAQSDAGRIDGTVVDARNKPLPGAEVRLVGRDGSTTSDERGRFTIQGVPTGPQQLEVRYVGFATTTVSIDVAAEGSTKADVVLTPGQLVAEILTVRAAPLLEGQAKAFSQQKTAPNIVNVVAEEEINAFPDQNSAEATQRIPGISIERDQGEGRYVLIRGTEARLNSMMVDGERLPSPEGDVRQVALDVISSDLIQSIEVSKVLTPDMDGDAIGGAVNFVLKDPPRSNQLRVQGTYGYGDLRELNSESIQLSWGSMSKSGRFGYQISGSYTDNDRASDNFEVEYDDGDLESLEFRNYAIRRTRTGFQGALDWFASPRSRFYVKGTHNEFDDQEYRRRKIEAVGDDEIGRELKDRFESQVIQAFTVGGEHTDVLEGALSWRLTLDHAEEEEPNALDSLFVQTGVTFNPNVTPEFIQPDDIRANPTNENLANFFLDSAVRSNNLTEEDNLIARVDLERPLAFRSWKGLGKVGLKLRDKSKSRDNDVVEFTSATQRRLNDLRDRGFDPQTTILGGRYTMGTMPLAGAMRALVDGGVLAGEQDFEEETADYDADERVYAAYGMAELFVNDRLMVLPGLRYEFTDTEYSAKEALFNVDGDFVGLSPVSGSSSYGVIMPHLHARYALDDASNVRAAFTRTFARPDFAQLAPFRLIIEEDGEIEAGNPELDPTLSWNLDLLYERYYESVGVLSAGLFYKDLTDYIYLFRGTENRGGEDFDLIQPQNGDDAELFGVEFAYVRHLRFAPEPLDGLGVHVNYTYTDSEATFPGREGSKATLPGQSEHLGNVALSYEKGGFSARASYNFHGKYIAEVGETPAEDIYYDDREQYDFIASYTFKNGLRLSLELNNLTDEPLRFYEGSEDRPIQEEYYSWYGRLGASFTF